MNSDIQQIIANNFEAFYGRPVLQAVTLESYLRNIDFHDKYFDDIGERVLDSHEFLLRGTQFEPIKINHIRHRCDVSTNPVIRRGIKTLEGSIPSLVIDDDAILCRRLTFMDVCSMMLMNRQHFDNYSKSVIDKFLSLHSSRREITRDGIAILQGILAYLQAHFNTSEVMHLCNQIEEFLKGLN